MRESIGCEDCGKKVPTASTKTNLHLFHWEEHREFSLCSFSSGGQVNSVVPLSTDTDSTRSDSLAAMQLIQLCFLCDERASLVLSGRSFVCTH